MSGIFERKLDQFDSERSYTSPGTKDCVATVGLPARCKSFTSKYLSRFLNWAGYKTRIFNFGEYSQKYLVEWGRMADVLERDNMECTPLGIDIINALTDELIKWIKLEDSRIAIFDAANLVRERRFWFYKKCKENNIRVLFVEFLCDDEIIIDDTIKVMKFSNLYYNGISKEQRYTEYKLRLSRCEEIYQPLDEFIENLYSFVKIQYVNNACTIRNLVGFFQPKIVYYLMNQHFDTRTIYLTRHGESEYNAIGRVGGDSNLTENGLKYARALADFLQKQNHADIRLWTSKLQRTIQTAQYIRLERMEMKELDEIDAGLCDGMTYEEIAEKLPDEFDFRRMNKFSYRYPRGEVRFWGKIGWSGDCICTL